MTYEEANWAKLSPRFRDAHNRLRQTRGLPPIPAPKIDLYVAPVTRKVVEAATLATTPEAQAAMREFLGPRMMGAGREGFTIDGVPQAL